MDTDRIIIVELISTIIYSLLGKKMLSVQRGAMSKTFIDFSFVIIVIIFR